ncbi:MAG: hypothetical protein WA776_07940 [Xanthobacteraceae bacterium]
MIYRFGDYALDLSRRELRRGNTPCAVEPFTNLSRDPGQDSLGDGLTEDLIAALAKADWLYVATRAIMSGKEEVR